MTQDTSGTQLLVQYLVCLMRVVSTDNTASDHKQSLFFTSLQCYQNRQMEMHLHVLSSY